MMDSMRGVTVLQDVQVEVLNRVKNRVFVEDEDWRRVWKSAGRLIEGCTRFETKRDEDDENGLEATDVAGRLAEVYLLDS